MGIISLVTGILGIFPCCTIGVFSIAAIILGVLGRNEVDKDPYGKKGKGLATAGLVCGIVGLLLGITYWVLIASGAIDVDYYNDFS